MSLFRKRVSSESVPEAERPAETAAPAENPQGQKKPQKPAESKSTLDLDW